MTGFYVQNAGISANIMGNTTTCAIVRMTANETTG